MDDIKFSKGSVIAKPPIVSRTRITNNKATDVTFTITAGSTITSMTSASADLVRLGGTNATPMTNISGGTSYRLTWTVGPGLQAGPKAVILTAKDSFGNKTSKLVRITNIDRLPPSTPSNFTALPGNTRALLSWSAASDETALSGYRIQYGTVTNVYTGSLTVGNVTSATLSGLVNQTAYFVCVRAVDAAGNEGLRSVAAKVIPHVLNVTTAASLPASIVNTNARTVLFRIVAATSMGSITNVTLDLTPLGGPVTNMPSVSAGTFELARLVASNQPDGRYVLPVLLSDSAGLTRLTNIVLTVNPLFIFDSASVDSPFFKNGNTTALVFDVAVRARATTVSSVTLTTPFGDKVLMTNFSGFTQWRYGMTILPSDRLKGTNYNVLVRAVTPAGSAASATILITVEDTLRPSVVQNLRGELDIVNGVVLEWDPATDETGVGSYFLLHGTSRGNYDDVTNVPANVLGLVSKSFFDDGVTNFYIVTAVDTFGNESLPSVEIRVSGVILILNTTNARVLGNYVRCGSPPPVVYVEVPEEKTGVPGYSSLRELGVRIYSPFGRGVRTLFETARVEPDLYYMPWDLKDDDGGDVPTGVYVAVIRISGEKPVLRKIMVVRCE